MPKNQSTSNSYTSIIEAGKRKIFNMGDTSKATLAGTVATIGEAGVDYWWSFLKVSKQNGKPISDIFKGSAFEIIKRLNTGMIPFQINVGLPIIVQSAWNGYNQTNNTKTTNLQRTLYAMQGGVLGAPIATIVNNIIYAQIHRGTTKTRVSPRAAIKHIWQQHGTKGFFHGFGADTTREAFYAVFLWQGYRYFTDYYRNHNIHEGYVTILASLSAGIPCAWLTQIPDTLGTLVRKHNFDPKHKTNSWEIIKEITKNPKLSLANKTQSLFRGGGIRTVIIASSIFWFNKFKDATEKCLDNYCEQQQNLKC